MRVHDNGSFFMVSCSKNDVYCFASKWPCFGRIKAYWFQFDKRNGDLVNTNHCDGQTSGGGIDALCNDAKAYGAKRLGLTF